MAIIDTIKAKAKADKKRILLPEGTEPRTVQAAQLITEQGIAHVTLFGKPEEVKAKAKELNVNLSGVDIIDTVADEKYEEYSEQFYEMRKAKGVDMDKAHAMIKDPLFFACMMIKNGRGDGMVSGAIHTTGDTLRPGLQIIKTAPGTSTVSGCFIMEVPNCTLGDNGLFLFADCAVTPVPTDDQLVAIAIASAKTARGLLGMEPRIAMLSFSTKGSAKHEYVDKVASATAKLHEQAPEIMVDGELQADAALIESVGQLKAPGSPVAGKANVLVFPDLQAGNIGYKLVQRLAKATAVGPICQGFAKPINDLSRGCSVEDIVSVVAITAVQAQAQ